MVDVLWLRLDAPLMSFGAPIVDNYGVIQPFPGQSMITGLLGNALGYDHRDHSALDALQARLQYASRADVTGRRVRDFQTVALGQDHLLDDRAWTTRGRLDQRAGANSTGTHIRHRDYWAEAVHTVALTLRGSDGTGPTVDTLEAALRDPQRPLFIGRKACLPATPLLLGRCRTSTLLDGLRRAPLASRVRARHGETVRLPAWWPLDDGREPTPDGAERIPVTDARDWRNQIHVGERFVLHALVEVTPDAQRTGGDHGHDTP